MSTKDDILAQMRRRGDTAIAVYSTTRTSELDDLMFAHGSPDNLWQWPTDIVNMRSGKGTGGPVEARPMLTINKLPQHIKAITNTIKKNRPSAKTIPVGDDGNVEVSDIITSLFRYIEYTSNAEVAYDTACESQVTVGEGYWRIVTEYCDNESFEQDIRIKRIEDCFSVYFDPLAQDPVGSDAEWVIITEVMSREDYKRTYPKAQETSGLISLGVGDQNGLQWFTEKTVTVAEYFYKEYKKHTLNMYANGEVAFSKTPEDDALKAFYGEPARSRVVDKPVVKWIKTNGFQILEETEWMGSYIPVVRVLGDVVKVQGNVYYSGIVRKAKDAQRMFNYWTSVQAEMLSLSPKAPFVAYDAQIEGYEDMWKTANTTNWSVLLVNKNAMDNQGSPLPLPQRVAPPLSQPGLIEARMGAADDIKSATGQYNSSLGATSNERTGKAIFARQEQSETVNFHYADNLSQAIQYGAKQILELIPKIYDTPRILQIMGEGGEVEQIRVDPNQEQAVVEFENKMGQIERIYNLNVGKYDVRVVTGPNYYTRRQEALESMSNVLQANPQLWSVAGDLFVKNMDWPGAQEMAKRIEKSLDPRLLDSSKSPELMAAQMQIEQMGQQMQQMATMLQNIQTSFEARELDREDYEAQIKAYDAETKRMSALQPQLSEQQIQDIVMGTIQGMAETNQLMGQMQEKREDQMVAQEPVEEGIVPNA